MKRLSTLLLAFTVAVGLLVGCDTAGPGLQDGGNGVLELHMTGASGSKALATTASKDSSTLVGSLDSASVTITRTAIISQGDTTQSDSTEADSTDEGDEEGIKVLTEEDFVVDLMDLQSGLDTLMAEVELEAGTYSQLRLITADQATVVFEDGTERQVMVASGQQTGFKVNFTPFTIDSADDRVRLTLSWNVENSLHGNRRGNLVITPAIQASVDTSPADTSGTGG